MAGAVSGLSGIPDATARRPPAAQPPDPTVVITTRGLIVRPDPHKPTTPGSLLIPAKGRHDYTGLRAALKKLRPAYARLPKLVLTPKSVTRWEVVVKTLAHIVRTPDGKPLFPVVVLAFGNP